MRSHVFYSSGGAYNTSQTSDAISDGDVLLVPDEHSVAVLCGAWPVAVNVGAVPNEFDFLREGVTWQTFDEGRYLDAATVAVVLLTVDIMRRAGLGTNEPLLNIARSYGWTGETPIQER